MRKRFIILFLIAMLSLLALSSCAGMSGGNGGDDPGIQNKSTVFNKIITNDADIDLLELKSALSDIVGPIISVNNDSASASDGEIVLGESGRAITKAAKDALESELSKSTKYDCGYVIYSDGKSIALYWQIDEMSTLAINKFISTCIEDKRLVLDTGIIAYEYFVKSEYESEKYWLNLESQAPAEVVAAFKRAYSYYDGTKLVGWIANLYDAEIGGFYYSNSARDYEPFLPDIESTSFAISQIIGNGALKNRNTQLPIEMQIAMVDFMKNMQSAKDGYFYHPQWPQDKSQLNGDRYGRDVANAASFITSFYIDRDGDGVKEQQRPNYCAPGTSKCSKHVGTDERCSFPQSTGYITSEFSSAVPVTLTSGIISAVSKVSESTVKPLASVSSTPDYSSADAFRAWLVAYNKDDGVKENSGQAHSIAERRMEIIDHGYMNIVLDYLDELLEEVYNDQINAGETPSGAFQYEANFRAVWGIYKYLCLYNLEGYGRKIDIKYVPYMVDTCIEVIGMPAENIYYVNDVMNQWTAISRIITNVKDHYGDAEAAKITERVRENAVYLIDNTLEKIRPFRIGDGSFAYTMSGCSLSVIYGTEISLGLNEGDLNSTVLATGAYKAMYTTMGYDVVNICTSDDGELFVKMINELEPITKKKQDKSAIDFENASDIQKVNLGKNTEPGKIELRDDPADGERGQSLYFESGTADARADSISFSTLSSGSGCNVFDVDMYVSSETGNGYLFQINLGTTAYFAMHKEGNKLRLNAVPNFDGAVGVVLTDNMWVDEWFNLRIEYYAPDGEELTSPITKIFVDGEFVAFSDIYPNSDKGAVPGSAYGEARFYSMRLVHSYVYFDNCYFAKETKIFSETDHTIIK